FARLLPGASGAPAEGQAVMLTAALSPPTRLLAVGADAGGQPRVRVYDAQTRHLRHVIQAGPASYHGGVRVAVADVTGDGQDDVIAAAGHGGGNRVRVFDGHTGHALPGTLGNFSAFTAGQSDGLFVAAGDVSGDGRADIIAG